MYNYFKYSKIMNLIITKLKLTYRTYIETEKHMNNSCNRDAIEYSHNKSITIKYNTM